MHRVIVILWSTLWKVNNVLYYCLSYGYRGKIRYISVSKMKKPFSRCHDISRVDWLDLRKFPFIKTSFMPWNIIKQGVCCIALGQQNTSRYTTAHTHKHYHVNIYRHWKYTPIYTFTMSHFLGLLKGKNNKNRVRDDLPSQLTVHSKFSRHNLHKSVFFLLYRHITHTLRCTNGSSQQYHRRPICCSPKNHSLKASPKNHFFLILL